MFCVLESDFRLHVILHDDDRRLINVALTSSTKNDYSEKILRGIAYKYGNNSHEYQMAGGTRKSDRKRTIRQSIVLSK
ncbi:hypothetical protein [Nostoc sp. MS1]|uniref:hypothetical protein n=1 Tax=Nostoc sp. MS1 TaxID=2764711 RepID=UPI001CC5F6AA|nr:hypothetical protein [Nostoc sp. MS1]